RDSPGGDRTPAPQYAGRGPSRTGVPSPRRSDWSSGPCCLRAQLGVQKPDNLIASLCSVKTERTGVDRTTGTERVAVSGRGSVAGRRGDPRCSTGRGGRGGYRGTPPGTYGSG